MKNWYEPWYFKLQQKPRSKKDLYELQIILHEYHKVKSANNESIDLGNFEIMMRSTDRKNDHWLLVKYRRGEHSKFQQLGITTPLECVAYIQSYLGRRGFLATSVNLQELISQLSYQAIEPVHTPV